jgi:hypothetical protein
MADKENHDENQSANPDGPHPQDASGQTETHIDASPARESLPDRPMDAMDRLDQQGAFNPLNVFREANENPTDSPPSATPVGVKKSYAMTGSQIYSAVTFVLSFVFAFGDDGFNFWGFVFLFAFFWLIAIPFRVLGWFSFRMNSRACAVCGNRIKNGKTTCSSCGTDFSIR